MRLGGDVQTDARALPGGAAPAGAERFFLRRARIDLRGRVAGRVTFRLRPNFAPDVAELQDAFARVRLAPWLAVRAGRFKAPFSLERLQAAAALMLPERAFPNELAPNRDTGVEVRLRGGRVRLTAGVFNGVASGGSTGGGADDRRALAARVFAEPLPSGVPVRLGLGLAATTEQARGTSDAPGLPALRTAGRQPLVRYAAAARLDGLRRRLAPQAYAYAGPVGVMAEWTRTTATARPAPDAPRRTLRTTAWQVTAQALLTGEDARFAPVRPARPVTAGGPGALEVAARLHRVAADAAALAASGLAVPPGSGAVPVAGAAWAGAVGLSWRPTQAVRAELAYERTAFDALPGRPARASEHLVLVRLGVTF